MAHIITESFYGNPNVGLYAFATDTYCLIGYNLKRSIRERMEKILRVPVHHTTICGTSLAGVFCAGNNSGLLIPSIAFEEELERLDKLNINYEVVDARLTALGNNILCNDSGCIMNPDFTEEQEKVIRKALGVRAVQGEIAGVKTVGSAAVSNQTHCLAHRDASEEELNSIRKTLNVKADTGTVNMANPYIKSGIICNSRGLIVGGNSGGPEVANADDVLGYLERERGK